jgi:hypothetical protein
VRSMDQRRFFLIFFFFFLCRKIGWHKVLDMQVSVSAVYDQSPVIVSNELLETRATSEMELRNIEMCVPGMCACGCVWYVCWMWCVDVVCGCGVWMWCVECV